MRPSRRQFVRGVGVAGLALLAGCGRLPGQAPAPAKIPRVGYLALRGVGDPDNQADSFRQGLRELGYVEGQNIVIESRLGANTLDEMPALAAELVQLPVDVMFAPSSGAALAAKRATSTIPIVFANSGDPVGLGLVDSLAHPGGNVTGLSNLTTVLVRKRLELLKETVPHATRVACFFDSADPSSVGALTGLSDAAGALGMILELLAVRATQDIDGALEEAGRLAVDAFTTAAGPLLAGVGASQAMVEFAARRRLPAMYQFRSIAIAGGLMSFGANVGAQARRAAYYVDRILKGARPADLPIEQPMTFEFVINLKTAQALGLTIQQHVLLQATEVIQ